MNDIGAMDLVAQLEPLMNAHDPTQATPRPHAGESVIAYWIRVLKFQAWNAGYDTGWDVGFSDPTEDDRPPNPYGVPS